MEHFYFTLDGWFDFEDVYIFAVNVAPDIAHFVEVGAFLGKSTSFMAVEIAKSKKDIRFDVVDTWQGSIEHQEGAKHARSEVADGTLYAQFRRNMKPVAHLLNPIQASSLEAVKRYKDSSLDFVFLDASHTYEDVKADIQAWKPKVKRGGYFGGHDYQTHFPGVIKAVNEEISDCRYLGFSWITQIK
jgi:predicted O-methyltransferase YrrM